MLRGGLIASAALVGLAGIGGGLMWSPLLRARTISVTGVKHLSREYVIGLSGITHGSRLLRLPVGSAVRRLEEDPWIASATIGRELPSSVTISVRERRPIAVALLGSTHTMLATDGTELGPARRRTDLPIVLAPVGTGYASGAARAIAALPTRLREQVESATAKADGSIELVLASGPRVLYGDPVDLPRKTRALAGVLRWSRDEGVPLATIDVRSHSAPAALPQHPGTEVAAG